MWTRHSIVALATALAIAGASISPSQAAMPHHVPRDLHPASLELPTGAPRGSSERQCLALAIYHEARGESLMGQIAVAQVIVNRVRSRAYPNTVCKVVYQNAHRRNRCQFSFACDRLSDTPSEKRAWALAQRIASRIMCTPHHCRHAAPVPQMPLLVAPLRQATHYHADYVRPGWGRRLTKVGKVGRHIFYRSGRMLRAR